MIWILDDLKDSHLHFNWKNVSIRDYDSEKQQWLVTTDDREHNVFDMYRPAKRNRKQMEAIEETQRLTENSITNGQFKKWIFE